MLEELLEVHNFEGMRGCENHLTRKEVGAVDPTRLVALPGSRNEHELFQNSPTGRYTTQKWNAFVHDIAEHGVLHPVLIVVEPKMRFRGARLIPVGPQISEGMHRIHAAIDAGVTTVPVEIRYFGKAEDHWPVVPSVRRTRPPRL